MSKWAAALPWVNIALRVVLGGVFIVAAVSKMPDPGAELRAVRAYRLVPESLVPTVAFGLPAVELVIGLALIAGLFLRFAALASGLLLVVFIGGVASAWARGLSIDCGCFGGGGQVAPGQTQYVQELVRDALLLLCAAFLVWRPRGRFGVDNWLAGPQPLAVETTG